MGYVLNLGDCSAKLARARDHVDRLRSEIETIGAPDYRKVALGQRFDGNSNNIVFYVAKVLEVQDEWPLIVGDALHNYRCTLDYLAWQLALRRYNGTIPERFQRSVQFPIVKDAVAWPNHSHLQHMTADDAQKLEPSQPFQVAGQPNKLSPLGVLAELSNWDKHRKINVIASVTLKGVIHNDDWGYEDCVPHINADGSIQIEVQFQSEQRLNEEVMKLRIIKNGPNPRIRTNVEFTRDLLFEQNWPVLESLDNIGIVVEKILKRF